MNRVIPEEVVKAYKRVGMQPTGKVFINISKGECCALGALLLEQKQLDPDTYTTFDTELLRYDCVYSEGFSCGFDNDRKFLKDNENFQIGFQDGLLVRKAVIKEFGEF